MDPKLDPGYFFKIYWFFTKQNFQICCLLFSLIFMLKLDEPFRNQEILQSLYFQIFQIWVLRVTFFVAVFGWYFLPWIRIQEAKILRMRIQRIRILSTGSIKGLRHRVTERGLKNQGLWQKLSSFSKQSLHYYEDKSLTKQKHQYYSMANIKQINNYF